MAFGLFAFFFSGEKDFGNVGVQFVEDAFIIWGIFVGSLASVVEGGNQCADILCLKAMGYEFNESFNSLDVGRPQVLTGRVGRIL